MNFIVNTSSKEIVSSTENSLQYRAKRTASRARSRVSRDRRLQKNSPDRFRITTYLKRRCPRNPVEAKTIYTCVYDMQDHVYYVGYDAGRLLLNDSPNEQIRFATTGDIRKKYYAVSGDKCGC